MCTENIYSAVTETVLRNLPKQTGKLRYLDIGAGRGELISRLREKMEAEIFACDYHTDRFALADIPIEQVDIDKGKLPYPDEYFDLITCSEVIEHLENYRTLIREAKRILRKGGRLVLTTPNVLNMKSRVRYLYAGFPNLFSPLPVKHDERYSTGGHITPIPYFYLTHALCDEDFTNIELGSDRYQKTSMIWLAIFFPLIAIGWSVFFLKEKFKYKRISHITQPFIAKYVSPDILLSRTIIVSTTKQ